MRTNRKSRITGQASPKKDYEVDDSNIVYTTITGETAIVSGYFLIKNANIDIVDHTIVQYTKNGYTKYYEPSYLKAHLP